jgi:hypothetical protein
MEFHFHGIFHELTERLSPGNDTHVSKAKATRDVGHDVVEPDIGRKFLGVKFQGRKFQVSSC